MDEGKHIAACCQQCLAHAQSPHIPLQLGLCHQGVLYGWLVALCPLFCKVVGLFFGGGGGHRSCTSKQLIYHIICACHAPRSDLICSNSSYAKAGKEAHASDLQERKRWVACQRWHTCCDARNHGQRATTGTAATSTAFGRQPATLARVLSQQATNGLRAAVLRQCELLMSPPLPLQQ